MLSRRLPIAVLLGSVLSSALLAQQTGTGLLRGLVVDASGAPVPGATLTLRHLGTGATRNAQPVDTGTFQFPALPIGEYRLVVTAAGMAPYRIESFMISVGQTVSQRVELAPAGVNEQVEVTAETEALRTTATTPDAAFGYDIVEETPSQNRNYLSFVFSAPGMSASAGANTQRSAAGTHNVANDSGFVFAGMRGRNNAISIDGVDNRDETTGASRVAIGLEMVQEFRVAGTSVSAEFGGAAGGIVNVVTRSGTNLWHGDATMFFQNHRLNARNAEVTSGPKQSYRREQPGFSLHGPLRRDRTFFASAIENSWERGQEWSETDSALRPRLERLTNTRLTSGLFPVTALGTEGSFKLNHALTARHSLTSRYAFSRGRVVNDVIGVANFSDLSARGNSLLRDHSLVSAVTSMLSPTTVNDIRVQYARRDAGITPNAAGPMIEIPGVITFGQGYRMDQRRAETHWEAIDSLSVVRGNHMVTMGASVHRVMLDARLANRFAGLFVFPTLADLEAGRPDLYIQAFGFPETRIPTWPGAAFIQDRWQLRPGLTLETGVRWEYQTLPAPLSRSTHNVAPRLGLAWQPAPGSQWVFRAGSGLFFDRYPLEYLNDAVQKTGALSFEAYAWGDEARQIYRLLRPPPRRGGAAYTTAAHFPSTYSARVTAGAERALDADTTLSFDYTFARGLNLPRIRNTAAPAGVSMLLEQTARSAYQGITATLNRRLARELSYIFTYTLSRTQDDGSDFDEHPGNPHDLRAERALSRQHQRHRLSGTALFEFPWMENLTIAPTYTYGSARPLNALDSADLYRTGAYPLSARPAGVARNPAQGPGIASLDLRVFKVIPILEGRAKWHAGAESFNLLNHTNPLRVSAHYAVRGVRLANHGQPVEVLNARQVQLFVALEF